MNELLWTCSANKKSIAWGPWFYLPLFCVSTRHKTMPCRNVSWTFRDFMRSHATERGYYDCFPAGCLRSSHMWVCSSRSITDSLQGKVWKTAVSFKACCSGSRWHPQFSEDLSSQSISESGLKFVLLSSKKTLKGWSGLFSTKVLHNDLLYLIICKQMTLKFVFINCSKSPWNPWGLSMYLCQSLDLSFKTGFGSVSLSTVKLYIKSLLHPDCLPLPSISCTNPLFDYMLYKKPISKY